MSKEIHKLTLAELYDILLEKTIELLAIINEKEELQIMEEKKREVEAIQLAIKAKKN
jgi:hypothetical protein